MKHSLTAIFGLVLLAAAVCLWLFAKVIQLVLILGVIGLIAVCVGVIFFNRDRLARIRRSNGG